MKYFLWLLPEPTDALFLNGVIHRLATIYEQIPHMAHITVASWTSRPDQSYLRKRPFHAINLKIGTPQIGPAPWQRLYLPVEPHLMFKQFQSLNPTHARTPHLSLLYGQHSLGRCLDIQRTLKLEFTSMTFTQLALIQGTQDIASWTEIARWQLEAP